MCIERVGSSSVRSEESTVTMGIMGMGSHACVDMVLILRVGECVYGVSCTAISL